MMLARFRTGEPFQRGSLEAPRRRIVPGFITSTGAEIRFFMPVLNVPFRLIFASNPQRTGVLNYSTRPAGEGVPVPVRRRLNFLTSEDRFR